MISLHIAKLLEDNGFGTLALTGNESGDDLIFFEKLPQGKSGVYIMSNGNNLDRGSRTSMSFDIYARGVNDVEGGTKLEAILSFFRNECYPVCDLPTVPGYSTKQYKNCVIVPSFNVTNQGIDATDRVIYSASANITYKEN